MYKNPATHPLFRLLSPLAIGCVVYLLVLLAFDTLSRVIDDFLNQELLVCIVISYIVLEANRLLVVLSQRQRFHRINFFVFGLFRILLALLLTAGFTTGLLSLYFREVEGISTMLSFATELKIFNGIFLFISLLYQGYFLGFFWLYRQYQEKIKEEEEKAFLLNHKIDRFHDIMHPDFFFAGLENIILKIRENKAGEAEEGIACLAGIYHYFLRQHEELVSLQEELAIVERLHKLLCGFSPHSLRIAYTFDEDENPMIIPGSLVRLVEAIAASQLSSPEAPLTINMQQEKEHFLLQFAARPSLRHENKLTEILHKLKQQYAWLGPESFSWQEAPCFRIYITTAKFANP